MSTSVQYGATASYRVPFQVVERDARRIAVRNVGVERLPWVNVELAGSGLLRAAAPGSLEVGESVELRYFGTASQRAEASLVFTWLRPGDDGPYLWRWGI